MKKGEKCSPELLEKFRQIALNRTPEQNLNRMKSLKNIPRPKEVCEKISKTLTGRKIENFWATGLTKETDERIKRHSERMIGNMVGEKNPFFNKHHSEESLKKMSDSKTGVSSKKKGKSWVEQFGEEKAEELKDQSRKTHRIIQSEKFEKYHTNLSFNKYACNLFDYINENFVWGGQHALNSGEIRIKELGYFPDYYDKEKNIVIEFYEKAHYNKGTLSERDIRREKEIIEFLNCNFIRINAYNRKDLKVEIIHNPDNIQFELPETMLSY